METKDLRNMPMNILNCLTMFNSIKDSLGIGKVNWERELELSCGETNMLDACPWVELRHLSS